MAASGGRWLSLLLLLILLHIAAAAGPSITRHDFGQYIEEVLYFDDSDVVLTVDPEAGIMFRSEDGGTKWEEVEAIGKDEVMVVLMNPYNNKMAVALGRKKHWITKDRGEKWKSFSLDDYFPAYNAPPLISFHASDSDRMIINTRTQEEPQAVYTLDGFETIKKLRSDVLHCMWAKENDLFKTGDEKQDLNRVVCVALGRYSPQPTSRRLLVSDDYFHDDEQEPALDNDRPVAGIVSIVAAKGFILAAGQASSTSEMALYVTEDTHKWHRANFGEHQLKEGGYTIMESTNYSLQVDVSVGDRDLPPVGALFTSNSHGYNFVRNEEHTNRNEGGYVDFEKVTNIQGIVIVNIVDNVEDVQKTKAAKKLKSQISFDDGRTFHNLKADGDTIHLHSITSNRNIGRVFSSPAPGIVMGVGNKGDVLKDYSDGDLYVSDDAGRSWRKALDGPHKYEMGDSGGILVAVADGSEVNKLSYSTNHGKDWQTVSFKDVDLPDDFTVDTLTTIPDSTTLKFIMRARVRSGSSTKNWFYTIDFNKLDKKECKHDDFERWYARVDEDGKPTCIMGHTQSFRRRKADADCFVGVKFKDPEPEFDNDDCKCTLQDFECDAGFKRSEDREKCIPLEPRRPSKGQCEKDEKTFKDTNGFRKIPGNECKGGIDKQGDEERDCSSSVAPPPTGEIRHVLTSFPTTKIREFFYLERSKTSSDLFGYADETIILLTDEGRAVYITHDHGKKWTTIPELEKQEIEVMYPHSYINDRVYLIGASKTVWYSTSRGKSFSSFDTPAVPNNRRLQVMHFHPKFEDWLIWTSCADSKQQCTTQAHVSKKNGADWSPLLKAVADCEFTWREGRKSPEEMIYCAARKGEDEESPMQLIGSDDYFDRNKTVVFDDMINFATMSEFIVVAAKEGTEAKYLKVDASVDGVTFADAKFPANLQVLHSTAYTVLDSKTHSIFLHVTVSPAEGREFGTIIRSNSNGTSYVMSLSNVNRNMAGYVDFEKLLGVEGVAIANIVANTDGVKDGAAKKLKTMITHNDGATWSFIKSPEKNADGKKYDCGKDLDKCALHLHGYTERVDPRDTYSSPSAVGFMFGVGNVGEFLGPKREGDTFMSSDGGITWRAAKSGQYMWEFGDQGSILVLVEEDVATDVVYYSQDEGNSWKEYKFSDYKMPIRDITTVPSDTSMNFLLWGTDDHRRAVTINIDFSGLAPEKCKLLDPSDKNSDYTTFEPRHPSRRDNCLFGHRWQYYRKKIGSKCNNGPLLEDGGLYKQAITNCTCTREDYECDFNYERDKSGSCLLVKGHQPITKDEFCKQNPDAIEFYNPTGFRRIPLTTCSGGVEYDKTGDIKPCKGHEEEFKKKHGGISGVGLFFAIVIPIAAAAGIGWYLFQRFEGQLGLGRIRLGESSPSIGSRRRTDWTKYPVMAVSGAAAVVLAIPMVVAVIWRTVREYLPGRRRAWGATNGPYRSRGSFTRRDYVGVGAQDETDLLGEDSDDDV